ncbi:MAG TPA: HEAT repeat domain-containing protein [Rhizomicrobium sp.]
MRILKQLVVAISLACTAAAIAQDRGVAIQGDNVMQGCRTLDACLVLLDQFAKNTQPGVYYPDHDRIAPYLQRFGEPAKQAMLTRANGADPRWRSLAGDVLAGWPSFVPDDVPALKSALIKDPGEMVARALAKIPTPEAIDALAEDVKEHGTQNQSGFALGKIGPRIFPNLVRALEDDHHWVETAALLKSLPDECEARAPGLARSALDAGQPLQRRLASLRAIYGCGYPVRAAGPQLAPLLDAPEKPIRDQAFVVLLHMRDSAVLPRLVQSCIGRGGLESQFSSPLRTCENDIAGFGARAQAFGPALLALTASPNGQTRALGAALLGYIEYQPAASTLTALLKDPDWRVVYAAARSLSWLKAKEADGALQNVSRTHWLPEVRQMAQDASQSFEPGGKPLAKPLYPARPDDPLPRPNLEVNAVQVPDTSPCKSGRWRYREMNFREPRERTIEIALPSTGKASGGSLSARDIGEFGGGLFWTPQGEKPETLYETNAVALARTNKDAVAAFGEIGPYIDIDENGKHRQAMSNGPSGHGFVLRVKRDSNGAWSLSEIARLPRSPDVIADIAPNRFAAWVGGRAIVFNLHRIEGIADCE